MIFILECFGREPNSGLASDLLMGGFGEESLVSLSTVSTLGTLPFGMVPVTSQVSDCQNSARDLICKGR